MAREKDVDMPRRGNFKGGLGQTSTTGGAKKKNAPVGMGVKPKAKPAKPTAKPKIGAGAKPKPKPKSAMVEQKKKPIRARLTDVNSPSRSTKGKVAPKKTQNRSGSMILGQGRNSPAAKKLKRTVGYGR